MRPGGTGVLSSGRRAMNPRHGAPKPSAPAACNRARSVPKLNAASGVACPGGIIEMTSAVRVTASTSGTGTASASASQRRLLASAAKAAATSPTAAASPAAAVSGAAAGAPGAASAATLANARRPPVGRRLQADQLRQRRRDPGRRLHVPGPASKTYVSPAELAACDGGKATEAGYVAGRDQPKKNTGQLGRWYVLQDDQSLAIRNSKRKSDPPIRLRRVFVHSTARAGAALTSRTKKLTRAKDDLDRLVSGLGGRFYPSQEKVTGRLQQIARDRKVGPYLRYTLGTAPATAASGPEGSEQTAGTQTAGTGQTGPGPADTWQGSGSGSGGPGKPALTWWFDQAAIDAEAATDGWYALTANLDATETAAGVLLRYKAQEAVERRYGNLKGPLAVAPMFLNSNRRIAALITVISLALLVFCLIEREARRNLAPQTKLDGLYNQQPA